MGRGGHAGNAVAGTAGGRIRPGSDLRPGHDDLRTAGWRWRREQHRGPPLREGWFQQYLSPHSATAQGLKVTGRYHFIGLGRFVPYLEVTGGAGGTSLRVPEIDSTFTFVVEAGAGLSYFVTDKLAINAGYRFQHISNGHTSNPNRGFESDSGVVGVSFYFK